MKSSRKSGVHNVRNVLGRLSLSRRDVELPRRDVKLSSLCHVATSNCKALCHVATWNSHVAMWTSHVATSLLHVATSFGHALCHVATLPRTSRRLQVKPSVTSRRDPAHRDVALFLTQECFIFHLHRTPLFIRSPSSLAHRPYPTLPELRSYSPTTVSHPIWPVLGNSGFFHHCVPDSSLGYSSLGFILVFLCSLAFF